MKKYKLVAIDIDGTLLRNNGTLSKKTIETIKKCEENGVKACICTGRNIKNTIKIARSVSKEMPFVCADGCIFYDVKNDEVALEHKLLTETFEIIMREVDKYNLYVEFCTKKYYIKYVKNMELEKFSYGGVAKTLKEKFNHYFIRNVRYVKDFEKFIKDYKDNTNQIIIAGEDDELEKIKVYLNSNDFSDVDIRYDLWDRYIFIVPKNCTKAYGLEILSKHFNIDVDDMIAIGDQMNDIDMIKKAGMGIAMGNAHDTIKKEANFITKTNEEDGVAYAINKFIFDEK